MFEFLGFGRAKKDLKSNVLGEPVAGQLQKSDLRREMIRLAFKSVLRRSGIPLQWMGCEVVPMPRSGESEVMLVQLVMLKWHEGLMSYAPELQNQLFHEIQFFDGSVDPASFLFVWKFAPDCGYPNGQLPEPGFWVTAPATAPAPAPVEQVVAVKPAIAAATEVAPAAKFDLPKSKFDDDGDDGFPATQIFDQK